MTKGVETELRIDMVKSTGTKGHVTYQSFSISGPTNYKLRIGTYSGTAGNKIIRKTCPCNVYPPEPHFYIAKLGYAGVYLFFLFLLQNIDCGYSLEPPRRGGSNVYPQSMF